MVWVLSDILLPLIAAFALGLLIGWLLWRWRRSRIDADGLSELRRSSGRYRADAERLEISNRELSDRLQAANGASGGDLANARKRIELLSEDLEASRREVAQLKSSAGNRGTDMPDSASAARIRELESQLSNAESRLSTLDAGGNINTANSGQGHEDLRREITSRDRMIATLKESLDQYGESGDYTSLLADVEIRDRKISELEALLAKR